MPSRFAMLWKPKPLPCRHHLNHFRWHAPLGLPAGWKLVRGGNGFANVVGPNDERLNLGALVVAKNGPAFPCALVFSAALRPAPSPASSRPSYAPSSPITSASTKTWSSSRKSPPPAPSAPSKAGHKRCKFFSISRPPLIPKDLAAPSPLQKPQTPFCHLARRVNF